MPKVFSTLSADFSVVNYKLHPPETRRLPTPIEGADVPVTIKGGANIATSPEAKGGRFTPKGVMTDLTDRQLEYCRDNVQFKRHEENHHIVVMNENQNADRVAEDHMKAKDGSAPLTDQSENFQGPDAVKVMKDED